MGTMKKEEKKHEMTWKRGAVAGKEENGEENLHFGPLTFLTFDFNNNNNNTSIISHHTILNKISPHNHTHIYNKLKLKDDFKNNK